MWYTLCLCLTLSLSACAQTLYEKPGATPASFALDKAQCDYQVSLVTSQSQAGIFANAITYDQLLKKCLVARGYVQH